jgi:hypothetical protein
MAVQIIHSHNDVLRLIAINQLGWLLRKEDVNNDVVIGWIGERGSCKSVSAGAVATIDHMVMGETCWSNMDINYHVKIDKSLTLPLGINPGRIKYEAQPLDFVRLLQGDPEYHDGVIVVDEINIALADGRRSMSNQNLMADDLIQLLRKLNSGFIYTCIHEMFVDNRIRDNTDIFILCKDNKFNPSRWGEKQQQGAVSEWHIYAMTDKGAYILQHEKIKDGYIGRWLFSAKEYWGIIPTGKKQERKKYALQIGKSGDVLTGYGDVEIRANSRSEELEKEWGWLGDKALEAGEYCIKQGTDYLKGGELAKIIGCPLSPRIKVALQMYGISYNPIQQAYGVNVERVGSRDK